MLEPEGAVVCRAVAAAVDSNRRTALVALAAGVAEVDQLLHLRPFLA